MANEVTLTIDNQQVSVPANTLVVDAAKKAGLDIPVFCYHPKLQPVGMCRMCLVEIGRPMMDRASGKPVLNDDGSLRIQFSPKLETACTVPVTDGMVVRTDTPGVQAARKDMIEFLLTSHPLDCPICDKGGECPLQNLTRAYGPGQSRFLLDEKMRLAKHVPLGDLIMLDRERCIQCARCVRFQEEVVGEPVIGFYHRGRSLEIVSYSDPPFDSYFSGNTSDICPVGALTTADFRFAARPWEIRTAASICTQCPVGCNTVLNTRREAKSGGNWVVKRVMPRQNEQVNEIWICDKGRFGYHYSEARVRLDTPLIRRDDGLQPATWEEALDLVEQRLRLSDGQLVTLAGGRMSNEDLFNLAQVTAHLGGRPVLHSWMGGGELVQQHGPGPGFNLGKLGAGAAIVVVASDLQEEAPIWWLRVKQAADRGAALIVLNPRPTRLDPYAEFNFRYNYGGELDALRKLVSGEDGNEPLEQARKLLSEAESLVVFYGSEGIGLDGTTALAHEAAGLLDTTGKAGQAGSALIAVWPHNNDMGAFDMGFRPAADLPEALASARVAWIAAADPAGDDPRLQSALDQTGFVIVQELFLTETAQMADVVLPALAFTERDGTFTSGERRVQRFYPAVPDRIGPLADYAIAARLGQRLGLALQAGSPSRVMLRIAEQAPGYQGLNYTNISRSEEQWPIIGRSDLYYGGTQYDNHQGLGVQLPQAAGAALASTDAPARPSLPVCDLLAVPITRLYDQGTTLKPSTHILRDRLTGMAIWLHPDTAAELGLHGWAAITGDGWQAVDARVMLDETIPTGVVLVPRSVGLPIWVPAGVRITPQFQPRAAKNRMAGEGVR